MTDYGQMVARLFHMDEQAWERHASPWSVWTRVASLPLLLTAIWSHTRLGNGALVPIALVILWLWLNPRLFPAPRRTDTWSAKATFGERVWLNRKTVPIPDHHARTAHLLTAISALGFAVALAGAILNNLLATVSGGLVAWFAKMWFCDRMVWLYDEMKNVHPPYAAWERAGEKEVR
ncbi:DUF6653 family protein [Microvirga roseola]|uniref:DUF6653 family protein n=1 Tax=Microvirga roseola TaxID=2883126 RepID=UPI001E5BA513|nr:DUF6653 family protein [Microvirga roseola]